MFITMIKLIIASDHAGFPLKEALVKRIQDDGISCIDIGTFGTERVDYPDYAHALVESLLNGDAEMGILICGSGQGMAIAANKYGGIRCALCWNKEIAELSRAHNNANVIALPGRFVSLDEAWEMVQCFLKTSFEGGRHADRVNKINPC
jgi:ribose 5-phosphate isomerase B